MWVKILKIVIAILPSVLDQIDKDPAIPLQRAPKAK